MAPNVWINAIAGLGLTAVFSIISIFLFYGMHRYYEMLKLYHRTPTEYDQRIVVKGDLPEGVELEDCGSVTQLWKGDGKLIHESDVIEDEDDEMPQIEVDIENKQMVAYGENPTRKWLSLSLWTAFASLVPFSLVYLYFALFGGPFSLESKTGLTLIAIYILITSIHFSIRIASLADIKHISYKDDEYIDDLADDIHNFAYSFFLSIYFLAMLGLVIHIFRNGVGEIISMPDFGADFLVVLFILIVFLPAIASYLSQRILRVIGVHDCLAKDAELWSRELDI